MNPLISLLVPTLIYIAAVSIGAGVYLAFLRSIRKKQASNKNDEFAEKKETIPYGELEHA